MIKKFCQKYSITQAMKRKAWRDFLQDENTPPNYNCISWMILIIYCPA